jgi:hypothetical protein
MTDDGLAAVGGVVHLCVDTCVRECAAHPGGAGTTVVVFVGIDVHRRQGDEVGEVGVGA